MRNDTELVKKMLNTGLDVNVPMATHGGKGRKGSSEDRSGEALICEAVERGIDWKNTKIVKMLIEAGADVTIFNNWCIKYAREHENREIISLLEAAGAK